MTTKTIGATGDYSTIQAWEDACPSNLVSTTQTWRGECENEEFVVSGATSLTVSGMTTSSTYYLELTTEAGASFKDHTDAATNPIRYDSAKGAAIHNSYVYGYGIDIKANIDFKLSNLQLKNSSQNNRQAIYHPYPGTAPMFIDDCIIQSNKAAAIFNFQTGGSDSVVTNTAIITDGTGTYLHRGNRIQYRNCTLLSTGTLTRFSQDYYGAPTWDNCLFLGAPTEFAASGDSATVDYCTTDLSSWQGATATNSNLSATASSEIEDSVGAPNAVDLRLKASATSEDGGKSSGMPTTDIVGQTRSGSYDIGCWEIQASGTDISASTDSLTLTENTATVNAETSIAAGVDSLTLTEYSASVSLGVDISATTDSLTLSEQAASINAETNVNSTTDSLSITTYAATVSTTADTNINATTDALTLTEQQATVNAETNVNASTDALTLTENSATVSIGTNISATTDNLTLSEQAATVNAENSVQATADVLNLVEYAATIAAGGTGIDIDGSSSKVLSTNYGSLTLYGARGNYYTI